MTIIFNFVLSPDIRQTIVIEIQLKKFSILGTDSCQGILGTEKSQNFTVKTFSIAASENKRPWIESRKYRKIFQEVLSDRIIIFSHEK